MDIEQKLEQYRVKQRRNQNIKTLKAQFKRFLMLGTGHMDSCENNSDTTTISIAPEVKSKKASGIAEIKLTSVVEAEDFTGSTDEENSVQSSGDADNMTISDQGTQGLLLKYILWAVYILFWITLYIIAIELKFGLVFLLLSALLGIYFNTRTGPKQRNEISAYSVFNKNCESIDGTLKAEQFEREIRSNAKKFLICITSSGAL